jgi:glycosyltransferase involved in cell wall biosynthesis
MNEQQLALAAAVDDGSVLREGVVPGQLSEGALEALHLFEEYRGRQNRIHVLDRKVAALQGDVDAHDAKAERLSKDIAGLRTEIAAREARIRGLERRMAAMKDRLDAAADALDVVQRRVSAAKRSRTWRLADGVAALRRRLTPGVSNRSRGVLDVVIGDIAKARRSLDERADDAEPPAVLGTAPRAPASRPSAHASRRKIAVLAWDVGHNPLGRAHTLAGILSRRYNVEIWGAQFERYGTKIWPPLRDSAIPIHAFPGHSMPEHLAEMRRIARDIDADAIYVSKPRFPSFGLGILAKEARNRPLVLDVDDDELAFFDERDGMDPFELLCRLGDSNLDLPFERLWTRAASQLIGEADALTVSNVALQERHGGVVVPHARDERVFDPARYDRDETRRRLGVGDATRLLLFGGTPRAHKGVADVLRALDQMDDDRYRLMLFETPELKALRNEIADVDRWVITLPYQTFIDLPALVAAADLACVLQDPGHPVTPFQLPAKIIDAMAMGVPCLVRPVPPLRPLLDQDVVHVWDGEEPLADRIVRVLDDHEDATDRAQRARKVFEADYSYEGVSSAVTPLFERLHEAPPRLTPKLASLTEAARRLFGAEHEQLLLPPRVPALAGPRRRPARGQTYDVVMFWKQNDSGIYGRRSDMFAKYLERSGRVRSIVHFDRPATPEQLYADYRRSRGDGDQTRLVVEHTARKAIRPRTTERASYYTYLYGGSFTRRAGLRARSRYIDYVRATLRRHGFGQRPMILWGYPANEDLPRLIDALDPDLVVSDVVDDHRTFPDVSPQGRAEYERNYREVLARTDVVLANCEPVAQAMAEFGATVHVIPNGLELRNGVRAARPKELLCLGGPIIGYVGNLSHRLDVGLVESLVAARPHWQFLFVGSAHLDRTILRIQSRPNVHFTGTRTYDEALHIIDHLDVALIPHVDNEMTRAMNPLKAYVYCSSGVPVVSTPVANIEDLESLITIAQGPDEFLAAIEAALAKGRTAPTIDMLRPHSWEDRIERALAIVDQALSTDSDPK